MIPTPDEASRPQASVPTRETFLFRLLALPPIWRWSLMTVGLLLAIGGSILIFITTSAYQSAQGTVQQNVATGHIDVPVFTNFILIGLDNRQDYFIYPDTFTPTPTVGDLVA